MNKQPQLRDRLIKLLAEKRDYRQEIKNLVKQYEYVVLYGCGEILNSIIDTWNIYIDRKINFCCDSDSKKWGKYFRNVRCISPQELMSIRAKCAVFVTIGDFTSIFNFLTERGFPSVNLIYKSDLVTSDFLTCHEHVGIISNLCKTYEFLSDEQSRNVFDATINRILDSNEKINVMENVFERNQYFPTDIIKLSDHENFVDIGAFNGDTIKDFIGRTQSKFDNIFSFEVSKVNFDSLKDNVKHMPNQDKIKIFNLGIWDSECDITYSIGNSQSTIGEGEGTGHVVALDDVLENEKVTFIKMDIEGAEPRALRGASNIIKTRKPKLAICIYHDFKHLWEIPHYIKELVPEYKIFLRHHTKLGYETVCYAVI